MFHTQALAVGRSGKEEMVNLGYQEVSVFSTATKETDREGALWAWLLAAGKGILSVSTQLEVKNC